MTVIIGIIIFIGCLFFLYDYLKSSYKNKLKDKSKEWEELYNLKYKFLLSDYEKRLEDTVRKYDQKILVEREQAIKSSKNVTRGQINEQLLPFFPTFPYNLSDCKFMGAPIDYVIFDGMSELRDTNSGEITIVFSDVKSGNARKTAIQKAIQEAISNGRVRFEEWRVDSNNDLKIK